MLLFVKFVLLVGLVDDDVIYWWMFFEMVGDLYELVYSFDLDWKLVWDYGWLVVVEVVDKFV